MKQRKASLHYRGFTIVELIVVISVIAVLATISVVGYGAWRNRTFENAIQSDLKAAASAMESARSFGTGYPTAIPSTFSDGDNVTVVWTSGDSTSYCLDGTATGTSSTFYIDSLTGAQGPQAGTCATRTITMPISSAPASVTAVLNTSSQIAMGWVSTAGATSYTAQCAGDPAFTINAASSTVAGLSTTIAGLTGGEVYCRVQGKNAAGNGPWSSAIAATFDITSGLVGQWKLNGNANDSAGSSNGTASGAATTNGQGGASSTAYYFDGVDDYISMAPSSPTGSLTNNLTVSAWINSPAFPATGCIVCAARTTTSNGIGFSTIGPAVRFTTYSVKDYTTTLVTLSPGTWYFVLASLESNNTSFYVNGAFIQTITHTTGGVANLDDGMRIGSGTVAGTSTSQSLFTGSIDDVRIYNRVLTASEVQALYLAGAR